VSVNRSKRQSECKAISKAKPLRHTSPPSLSLPFSTACVRFAEHTLITATVMIRCVVANDALHEPLPHVAAAAAAVLERPLDPSASEQ
jgi:hypothetical protein